MTRLSRFSFDGWADGLNTFANSTTQIRDTELAEAQNVWIEGANSVSTAPGWERVFDELPNTIDGWTNYTTDTFDYILVASDGDIKRWTGSAWSDLTGAAFSAGVRTWFVKAYGRCYVINGTDTSYYTSNGTSLTSVTSGKSLLYPVEFAARIYGVDPADKSKVWFSNAARVAYSGGSVTLDLADPGFGQFDTNLSATPVKNAGFFIIPPGQGVEITGLFPTSDSTGTSVLDIHTARHGMFRVDIPTVNSDNTLFHNAKPVIRENAALSNESIIMVGADELYFSRGVVSLGEVAQFQNIRPAIKSGSIQPEFEAIPSGAWPNVALGFWNNRLHAAYQAGGSYNNRIASYNILLKCWDGLDTRHSFAGFFQADISSERTFLGVSDNPSDNYLYKLVEGQYNDDGDAYTATFRTKDTDCGNPVQKGFAFAIVRYAEAYGSVTVNAYIDGVLVSIPQSTFTFGTPSSTTSGNAIQPHGTYVHGVPSGGGTASGARDGEFVVDLSYLRGNRIGFEFENTHADEKYSILGIEIWYLKGEIYERKSNIG